MTTRSAHYTIQGYSYQFDRTIIEILSSAQGDVVTVEGIEDIDLKTQDDDVAIQCKYYETQNFSLVSLRSAVRAMLADSATSPMRQYRIFIHCKNFDNFISAFTLDDLKRCLTEKHKAPKATELHYASYSESALRSFISRLTLQRGASYSDQVSQIRDQLKQVLAGTAEDCEDLFHPAARDVILEKAVAKNIRERKITRADFISRVSLKQKLFTRWHREQVGEDRFVQALRRQLRNQRTFLPSRRRFLLLAADSELANNLQLVSKLAAAGPVSGSLRDVSPWTIVVDADATELVAFKCKVLGGNIRFTDGFESIAFSPSVFDEKPLINTIKRSSVVDRSSHELRLIGLSTYRQHAHTLQPPDAVFTTVPHTLQGWESRSFNLTGLSPDRVVEILGV